jgi:transposase
VLLEALHAIHRLPKGQDVVSYGRLVTWAKEAAGTRDGTAGKTIGKADLTWAFAEAAVLFLRPHPAGQKCLVNLAPRPGTGTALTARAHPRARAVSDRRKRQTVFDRATVLPREKEPERVRLASNWTPRG